MMNLFRLCVMAVSCYGLVCVAAYTGRVTCGGKGLGGVLVSDGQTCVRTDDSGKYELPGYERTHFVSVTVPAGYRPSARHYLAVTAERTDYSFELLPWPRSAGNRVQLLQFADTEQASGSLRWAEQARDYAHSIGAAAILHTGDICYAKGLHYHAEHVNPETLKMPIYYTNGNHDLLKADDYGEQTFEKLFGPTYYSFEVGRLHVVSLPIPYGDAKTGYRTAEVARWLKNDLSLKDPAKGLVVFTHMVKCNDTDLVYGAGTDCPVNLADYGLSAVIFGHHHEVYFQTYRNGAVAVCSPPPGRGGIDFSPGSFPVYTFEKTKLVNVERRHPFINPFGAVVFARPGYPVLFNAYSSVCNVEGVQYRLKDGTVRMALKDGTVRMALKFKRCSDWTWKSEEPLPPCEAVDYSVKFQDGTIVTGTRLCDNHEPENDISADAVWNSAYGNAQRNAVCKQPFEGAFSLKRLWTVNVGNAIYQASPVIWHDRVMVGTMPDSSLRGMGVVALNLRDGAVAWRHDMSGGVRQSLDVTQDGIVIAGDDRNVFKGLSAKDGQVVWSREDLAVKAALPQTHANILDGARFICNSGSRLLALEAATGNTLWENAAAGADTLRAPTAQSLVNGVVFWARHWGSLNGYDAATGKLLWLKKDKSGEPGIYRYHGGAAIPAGEGQALKVGVQGGIFWLDCATGDVKRRFAAVGNKQVGGAPLVVDNMIVYGTADSGLYGYDLTSGEQQWNLKLSRGLVVTSPYTDSGCTVHPGAILVNGYGVVGMNNGCLVVFNPKDGKVVAQEDLNAPILAPVAVVSHRLVVADMAGNVHCFAIEQTK